MIGQGLHRAVGMDEYVADPCEAPSLSAGTMHTLVTRSPAHAWVEHPRLNPDWRPDVSTRAEIGTAVHAAILGGDGTVVFAPPEFDDWRTKAARAFRDEARASGRVPLLDGQREQVQAAADAGKDRLDQIAGGDPFSTECTLVWRDGDTWKRGRPDALVAKARTIVDVKTMEAVSPEAWIRSSLHAGGYDIQAAHYLSGAEALGMKELTDFVFLLVEIEPPYSTALVSLDPEYMELARRRCRMATEIWARCMKTGNWPGYDARIHWAAPPPWIASDFLDREAAENARAAGETVADAVKEKFHG